MKLFTWRRFHFTMMGVWALLIIPTVVWWSQMILWVAFIGIYNNWATHFSAWRADEPTGGEGA